MKVLEQQVVIPALPDHAAALESLMNFYMANGYQVVEDPAAAAGEARADHATHLVRGKKGAGWWASNMTELHAAVQIVFGDGALKVLYTVDVQGQHLTDAERAFWEREARRAEQVARGKAEIVDLRPFEQKRAENSTRSLRRLGMTLATLTFIVIIALALLGII